MLGTFEALTSADDKHGKGVNCDKTYKIVGQNDNLIKV